MKRFLLCVSIAVAAAGCGADSSDELEAALERIEELEAAQQDAAETTSTQPTTTSLAATSSTTTAPPATTTAAPATTTSTTTTVPICDASWSAAPDVTSGWPGSAFTAPGRSLQEEVRIGTHPGYDRFLIEFEEDGRTPSGWSVGWISGSPIHDGSGEPVDMEGNEFLEFGTSISRVVTYPEAWYQGPQEFFGSAIGTGNLVEAEMAGDYEGYVTWYVSTQTARRSTSSCDGPARLVVDICH